jgi:hypothetical protein
MRRARPQLSILLLVLTACAPRVRRTPDDTLVCVLQQNILELDPRWTLGSQELKVSRLIAPGWCRSIRPRSSRGWSWPSGSTASIR